MNRNLFGVSPYLEVAGAGRGRLDAEYSVGVLTNEQIAAYIEARHEVRAVEFKGPGGTSDAEFVAKVARATTALANQRDGG